MQSLSVLAVDPRHRSWKPLPSPWPISHFDNIAINLTNYCPVQCSFCFMKADPVRRRSVVLSSEALDGALDYAKEKKMYRIDVSGGEAISEMGLLLKILREAEVESISITTSGYFAVSDVKTRKVLDALADALVTRRASGKDDVEVRIHLSVDEFHSRVPLDCVKRIIIAFDDMGSTKYADMVLELRSILMDSDPIPKLVQELGGKIADSDFSEYYPTKQIIFASRYRCTVHYGEMKLLSDMLGTELATKQFDKVYENRLKVEPVYIGRGKRGGVSIDVSYDGTVTLQEYLAKDFALGNANDADCFEKVDRRLSTDPLVVALREIGLNTVLDIVTRLRPEIRERSIAANNMYLAVSEIVNSDELREYVYQELIQTIETRRQLAAATPSVPKCKQLNSPAIVDLPRPVPWRPMQSPHHIECYENILVALTNWCPVQCSFCFMEAVPKKVDTIRLDATAIGRVIRFVNQNAVPILDLTGGEALSELDTVVRIVIEVDVERVSISTSGYFATNPKRTEMVLDELAKALDSRKELGKRLLVIDFRVSADEFHWHITSRVLGRLLETFERLHDSRYRKIGLELRGILSKNDPVPEFIRSLNGRIDEDPGRSRFPLKRIALPSGYTFNIKYGEMKLTENMLGTAVAETEFDKIFGERMKQETIIIGKGKQGGVSFSVSHDGVVALQEFLARKYPLTNVNSAAFFEEIERRLTLDPLVVGLRTFGLNTIMEIAENKSPGITKKSIDANNQFMAVLSVVDDEDVREHVYEELTKRLEGAPPTGAASSTLSV